MTHDGFRTALHGRRIAISVLALAGSLTSACTASTSSAPSSSPVATTQPAGNADGAMVDINTGAITPLPASIRASGASYYAVSPDHTEIAYSACCTPPDPLFVANLDGTGIRRVSPPGQDAYGAQWSPDGSKLVYQQRDGETQALGNLFVVDVKTGQQTQLTHFDQTQQWEWWFTFPSFAPDRDVVFFQLPRGSNPYRVDWDLWGVMATGGEKFLVARNAGWGGLGSWRLSRNLAFISHVNSDDFTGGALQVTSFDVRGTSSRAFVRNGHLTWLRWSPGGPRISYSDDGWIYVVDVSNGSITKVAKGGTAEWFDDHTLIVGPGGS